MVVTTILLPKNLDFNVKNVNVVFKLTVLVLILVGKKFKKMALKYLIVIVKKRCNGKIIKNYQKMIEKNGLKTK